MCNKTHTKETKADVCIVVCIILFSLFDSFPPDIMVYHSCDTTICFAIVSFGGHLSDCKRACWADSFMNYILVSCKSIIGQPTWRTVRRPTKHKPPPASTTFTFWGRDSGQGVHVRRLPALHHGLAHDLQVRVGRIVARAGVVPHGLAVLSLWEYGLSRGGHVVWMQFGCGERFDRPCLHTEEGGERKQVAFYIWVKALTRQKFGSLKRTRTVPRSPKILWQQDASLTGE